MARNPGGKPTRRSRRETKERKTRLRDWIFATLLALLPEVHSVQVVPWGIISVCAATCFLIHLYVTHYAIEDDSPLEKTVGAWCLCIVIGTITFLVLEPKWREEKAAALEGDLFLASSHATHSLIQIGVGNRYLDAEQPTQMLADADLKVENDHGHLLVSTTVRDQQGKEVVRLERNHWTVNPDKAICLDKNYTDDSLEVKDGGGHVVFQVRLFPDHVQLQGEWANGKGADFLNVFNRKENRIQFIIKSPTYDPKIDAIMIDPLFRYPSSTHWAEWLTDPYIPPSTPPKIQEIVSTDKSDTSQHTHAQFLTAVGLASDPLLPFREGQIVQLNLGFRNVGDFSFIPLHWGAIIRILPHVDSGAWKALNREIQLSYSADIMLASHDPTDYRYRTFAAAVPLSKQDVLNMTANPPKKKVCILGKLQWRDDTGDYETHAMQCMERESGGTLSVSANSENNAEHKLR
jgi:hypothetical protein